MKKFGLAFIIIFLITVSAISYVSEDLAMVTDIKNGSACYESGDKKGQQVILMDFLKEGDRIKLEPYAKIVLNYFTSGQREEITGPGTITVGSTASKKEDETVEIKSEKVDYFPLKLAIETRDLQQTGAVVLRGGSGLDKITLLSLANTAIRSTQPVFRWQPLKGADTYKVRLYDLQDRLCLETSTDKTTLTYDNSGLIRGARYWWNVLALAKGEIIAKGEGQFSILTEGSMQKLLRSEQVIKKRYPKESSEFQINLALLYENYNLYDDAVDIFGQLHRKYPHNKNIIHHLKSLCPSFTIKNT